MMYLGDYKEDATLYFCWATNDKSGASITRSTDGTIKVRRSDGTDCTGTSVTDNEDTPDVGIHECIIDLSDNANYAVNYDYVVWLDGAVIDGETVNAVLATFSIENRTGANVASAVRVLINKATYNKETGVVQIYNDAGTEVVLTLTPTEDDSILTRTPS